MDALPARDSRREPVSPSFIRFGKTLGNFSEKGQRSSQRSVRALTPPMAQSAVLDFQGSLFERKFMRKCSRLPLALFVISCSFMACSKSKKGSSGTSPSTSTDEIDSSLISFAQSALSSATKTATHSDTYYFAPFPFASILDFTYTPSLSSTAAPPTNLQRYLLKADSGHYLSIGDSGVLSSSATFGTYANTLNKIVQVMSDSNQSSWFRLDSELHGIYSLDADASGNLSFASNRGSATSPSNRGYVVFAYDSATRLLQAKARYSYNLTSFEHSSTADASFPSQNYYVKDTGTSFILVASSANASPLTFVSSPIDVQMPKDFNPDSIAYQSNPPVAIKDYIKNSRADLEGATGKVQQDMDSAYLPQVAAIGDDAGTETAATTMLTTIESTLTAEGASLRYPKQLYLAFRKAALRTTLKSDGLANGTLGMNNVPYVYFTNASDSSGLHHPFMVIATYSIADKPNRLQDVRRPPGDGTTGGYADQHVTRDATLQLDLVKIPLKNYGNISSLTENELLATLNSDEGQKLTDDVFNYASTSGVGVAVDGVIIYPIENNTLVTAHSAAEITSNGIHVGQGMGLHYHGDGHSIQTNDLNLYNIQDYEGQKHPPVIGFGLDGIALFGIYEKLYADMEGYSQGLDTYGGHTHGDLGYHYHAHMYETTTTKGNTYTVHALMRGAWKGLINQIPEFWDTSKKEPAYSLAQKTTYVGKH